MTHFFSKILQRNSRPFVLGNLSIASYTHLKWWYQFEESFNTYLQVKNQFHFFYFPWDITKILQTCYFRYAWILTPKVLLSTRRKISCLPAGKKSTSAPTFFWRYCKDMQTSYFGFFGHSWLPQHKWYHRLVENFNVYLHAINKLPHSLLS